MRPASRNPESAQTLPHVKPPKIKTHQEKKISKEATLKSPKVTKIDTQTTKKVKKKKKKDG